MTDIPPIMWKYYEHYEVDSWSYQKRIGFCDIKFLNMHDFAFCTVTDHDLIPATSKFGGKDLFLLDSHLAGAYHATLCIAVNAIYSATHGWNVGNNLEPMPTMLPDYKVQLLGIGPLPLPHHARVESNILELAGDKEVIKLRVEIIQMLTLGL